MLGNINRTRMLLIGILAGFFIISLCGIKYGLPYHLFGDEEALVYGTLRMMELKTIFPIFHWEAFNDLLYYPPYLNYIYLFFFLPAGLIKFLVLSSPSLEVLKISLISDPSIFWYVARLIGIVFGTLNTYFVYRIAIFLFKKEKIGLLAALFFGFSFFNITISQSIRHWTPSLFFGLVSVCLACRAIDNNNKKYLIFAGCLSGISFGINYLVFLLPFVGFLFVFHSCSLKKFFENLFYFSAAFLCLALPSIIIHPQAFLDQVHFRSIQGSVQGIKTPLSFIYFYLSALWNYEPLLLIFGTIGGITMFFKDRKNWIIVSAFFVVTAFLLYKILWYIPRYLLPILPFLSMVAAYGINSYWRRLGKWGGGILIAAVVFYFLVVFVRYDYLLIHNDSRIIAKKYVEEELPKDAQIFLQSEKIKFFPTTQAAKVLFNINSGALRAIDRVSLGGDDVGIPKLNYYKLYNLNEAEKTKLISLVSRQPGEKFFVLDTWAPKSDILNNLIKSGVPILHIVGEDDGGSFPNLFVCGEEKALDKMLIIKLFSIKRFGPSIDIYKL